MNFTSRCILSLFVTATAAFAQDPAFYGARSPDCNGSNGQAPVLSSTGLPVPGTTMSVELSGAIPNASAFMTYGERNEGPIGGIQLPIDLGLIGAPGCWLYHEVVVTFPVMTSAAGTASCPLTIPNNTALYGYLFYNQFMIVDPAANSLGLISTGLGIGRVGPAS